MAEQSGLSFAGLLRQLRAEARLTQEELAEAASLSPRSVGDLERGVSRTAHKETAQLLAGALGLAGPVRGLFVAAARGKGPAAEVLAAKRGEAPRAAAAATRALPRDVASFTGRGAELAQLLGAIDGLAAGGGVVGIHAIDGMAGIGKPTPAICVRHHPAWTPGELAAGLAVARDRLALMHAENLSVGAAFGLSYQDLPDDQQRLFRRLGLHPGPGIDAYAAAALDGTTLGAARRGLEGLYDQHLFAEPARGGYQLHDLIREHARTLAAADSPAESDAAADRLLPYYLHSALAAGRHFDPRASIYRRPPPCQPPTAAPDLSTLGQAAAWLEADRANLHAAADYAAGRARFPHAFAIPAAISGFLAARGHWDQSAALHHSALAAARQAGDRLGEADTLGTLGELQRGTGDYLAAAASLAQALALTVRPGTSAARHGPSTSWAS